MAIAVEPFNGQQIQDRVKADTGKDFPPGGPNGLNGSGTATPGEIDIYDPTGTFTDGEIAAAIAAVVYDEDYGRDPDRVALMRQAYDRMIQIKDFSGNFNNAQASTAIKNIAQAVAQVIRVEYAPGEAQVEP